MQILIIYNDEFQESCVILEEFLKNKIPEIIVIKVHESTKIIDLFKIFKKSDKIITFVQMFFFNINYLLKKEIIFLNYTNLSLIHI